MLLSFVLHCVNDFQDFIICLLYFGSADESVCDIDSLLINR